MDELSGLEARQYKNMMFDFYGSLLTEKQREIFTMHYDEDCSLGEISKVAEVTPQAVADILKRTNKKLYQYEEKLGLLKKYRFQQELLIEIEPKLNPSIFELIKKMI